MITDLKINEENKKRYYEQGYWTEKTVNDIWNDRVAAHPDREYISDDMGVRLTYAEIDDKAARLASWLREQGIQNGDVVTFQMPPWSEFAILYVACLKMCIRDSMSPEQRTRYDYILNHTTIPDKHHHSIGEINASIDAMTRCV